MRWSTSIEKEMFQDAINDLTKEIILNPVNYEAYHLRGLVFFIINEYEKAQRDLTQSVKIHPSDDFAQYLLELVKNKCHLNN